MKIVPLTLSVALVGNAAFAVPKPAIDPRTRTVFESVRAHYAGLKSFSVVGHETIVGGGRSRFARLETSLQFPYRARLQIDSTDSNGKITVPRTRRLVGAKSYQTWDLVGDNLASSSSQFTALGSAESRARALKTIYLPAPDLALSVFTIAAGGNLANMPNVSRATLVKTREGGRVFDKITLVRQDPGDPNPIVLEYFVSPRREIERFVLRRRVQGQNFVATLRFEPLKLNWKGSQSATDAAIYNWKSIALPGINAPAPRPKTVLSVDPKARQIFARATTLYGDLKGLQFELHKKSFDPQYGTSSDITKLAYDANGRWRLETPDGLNELLVIDGKTKTTLDLELDYDKNTGDEKRKLTYEIEEIEGDDAVGSVESELETVGFDIGPFSSWLRKENPLQAEIVTVFAQANELRELRAAVLPAQNFGGQVCDLVRITTRFDDPSTTVPGETVKQETFWFAPGDGRLVRIQTRSQEGNQKPRTQDWQVVAQQLNPTFEAQTFVFTPPPGAIQKKD